MPLLRWRNPGHDTRRASSMVRGAGCREINLRVRRREKNVLDIPFYRSGVNTHPMREDVKRKHFSTLSVRPRSVLASRPLLLGEDLVLTPQAPQSTTGSRAAVAGLRCVVSGRVPTPFVAKLSKPTVGLSANHHPMGGSSPMAFLGYPRHLSKFVKSLFSALTMRSTEYPQRFHNVFP